MEKTVLIPEDYVGATIAQRTDRQGTLPFDFLSLKFPQISIPGIREIRVSSHINFELKADFIVEFAKNAVKPINKMNVDFASGPKKLAPDINISNPPNIQLRPGASLDRGEKYMRDLENAFIQQEEWRKNQSDELVDIDAFIPYFRKELLLSGLDVESFDKSLKKARYESDLLTDKLSMNSSKGVSLLRKYLQAEEAKTKQYEKMIDQMKRSVGDKGMFSDLDMPV
jgi:hypothetical protein